MRITVDVDLSNFNLDTGAIENAVSQELERTALRIERQSKELAPVDVMFTTTMNMDKYYDNFRSYGWNDNQIKNSHYTTIEMFSLFDFDISKSGFNFLI